MLFVWFLFGICFWSIALRCQIFDERNPALCLSADFIRAKLYQSKSDKSARAAIQMAQQSHNHLLKCAYRWGEE
jgi:hypothetical protein